MAAFFLLRLSNMKFTVISTSRDIRITRACMDSDEKTILHNAIVPTAQQLNS